MAITNVISNTPKVFKDIIVKNNTNANLKNLHLLYNGEERSILNIPDLPRRQQLKKSLLVNYLSKPTDLILAYNITDDNDTDDNNDNDNERKILAYENLSNDDLRTLTLTILDDTNGLKVDSSVES